MTEALQHIDSFTMTDNGTGVVWTMSWDANGQVSYKGVDANGNVVSTEPPSSVLNAVSEREAKRDGANKPEESQKAENKESKEASEASKTSSENNLTTKEDRAAISKFFSKNPELKSVGISRKGEMSTNPPEMIKNLSEDDKKFWRNYLQKVSGWEQVNDAPRGLVGKFEGRGGLKSLTRGSLKEDFKQTFKEMVADGKNILNEMVRMPKDLIKAGRLITQGKFRELRDRAALRVHDNLEAMGVLSDRAQGRIAEANKKIEDRLGITNREKRPDLLSQRVGEGVRSVKSMVAQLRGVSGKDGKSSRISGGQKIQTVPVRGGAER